MYTESDQTADYQTPVAASHKIQVQAFLKRLHIVYNPEAKFLDEIGQKQSCIASNFVRIDRHYPKSEMGTATKRSIT
jgi:hypothetical protein